MRLSRRLWRTVSTGCSFASRASLRTITFWTPISARSIPISRVTPRPKRMLEAAISNAYSSAMRPPRSGHAPRGRPTLLLCFERQRFSPGPRRSPSPSRRPGACPGLLASPDPCSLDARLPPSRDGGVFAMPEKRTVKKARKDLREGKRPTTAAGEFVHEEMDHIRQGKHGARSTKQAIAIGLSKARRAGVPLKPPRKGRTSRRTRRSATAGLRGRTGEAQGEVPVETEESGRLPGPPARAPPCRIEEGALPAGATCRCPARSPDPRPALNGGSTGGRCDSAPPGCTLSRTHVGAR